MAKVTPAPTDVVLKDFFCTRLIEDAVALTPGTTVAMDASTGNNFTLTPAQACTINVTNPQVARYLLLEIVTSGTTSFVVTFGTGFKTTGTLTTGTVTAKKFLIVFYDDGTDVLEVSRTAAL